MSGLTKAREYLSKVYHQHYKPYLEEIKSPDGKTYVVDGAKLQSLNVILKFDLDKCYIGKSNLEKAGNGLFAKKDLLKGEIITFYPGDVASYVPNGDMVKSEHVSLETYSQRFKNQFEDNIKNEREVSASLNKYTYDVDDNYRIIGSPFFKDNTNYMGHFINDGAAEFDDSYLGMSTLKSNCGFYQLDGLHVAVISTTNIKKDEEFYITYGMKYWKNHNKRN